MEKQLQDRRLRANVEDRRGERDAVDRKMMMGLLSKLAQKQTPTTPTETVVMPVTTTTAWEELGVPIEVYEQARE